MIEDILERIRFKNQRFLWGANKALQWIIKHFINKKLRYVV